MKGIIKRGLIILVMLKVGALFSAGVNIKSNFPTKVWLYLDNGVIRTGDANPSEIFKFDAFFAGFSKIQWLGPDGHMYEAPLRILGHKGWYPIIIYQNNTILVNEEGSGFGGIGGGEAIGNIQGNRIDN